MTAALDSLVAVLMEGADVVGTPMRAACLFSDRGVAVIDVSEDRKPTVPQQMFGTSGGFELPVLVSLAGPRGMLSGKITPENPAKFERVN